MADIHLEFNLFLLKIYLQLLTQLEVSCEQSKVKFHVVSKPIPGRRMTFKFPFRPNFHWMLDGHMHVKREKRRGKTRREIRGKFESISRSN